MAPRVLKALGSAVSAFAGDASAMSKAAQTLLGSLDAEALLQENGVRVDQHDPLEARAQRGEGLDGPTAVGAVEPESAMAAAALAIVVATP